MSLIKWNPESPLFSSLSNWMDDLFPENSDFPQPMVKGISIPAVNVTESDKAFTLEVAAPGFKKEDFTLEVKNGYLMISAETEQEEEKKEEMYTRREFRFNSFKRSFALPDNVLENKIKANYEDGILLITVPKSEKVKDEMIKKISVQ